MLRLSEANTRARAGLGQGLGLAGANTHHDKCLASLVLIGSPKLTSGSHLGGGMAVYENKLTLGKD